MGTFGFLPMVKANLPMVPYGRSSADNGTFGNYGTIGKYIGTIMLLIIFIFYIHVVFCLLNLH